MTGASLAGSPYDLALATAGERDRALLALEVGEGRPSPYAFAQRYPERLVGLPADPARVVAALTERTPSGAPVFLRADPTFLFEEAFGPLVRSVVVPRANVKLVGDPLHEPARGAPSPARDGLGSMRNLPAMTVVAPADGPSTEAAVGALAARTGPAYLELPPLAAPSLGGTTFAVGRAEELRSGSDLAIAAYGSVLARAVALADDLRRVGVSARVLDLASLKPIDEAALLRAARDTGAILVAEAAPLASGIGSFVAALTAENHPVPVRRLGYPDLWPGGSSPSDLDAAGLSADRLRDEAWELLRLRGKVQ